MDVFLSLSNAESPSLTSIIKCVDMHTCGEVTRIVVTGYPDLTQDSTMQATEDGSSSRLVTPLLLQRQNAQFYHDNIRRTLILEPRGHHDMYGAVLLRATEATLDGSADMGVLFLTNDGYSSMCGHATIALGRLLIDTQHISEFPNRSNITIDKENLVAHLRLHAPCGIIAVSVPVLRRDGDSRSLSGWEDSTLNYKSDPSRPVSFVNVPSFATGRSVQIDLSPETRWPELCEKTSIQVDFSYGGAFYCLVPTTEMGFTKGLEEFDFDAIKLAGGKLKAAAMAQCARYFTHPEHEDLSFLYSIMIVDQNLAPESDNQHNAETGLCFFADGQVDRSPTGSAVAARVALAHAKGELSIGQSWTYHSLLSAKSTATNHQGFIGTLLGTNTQYRTDTEYEAVDVKVEGYAFYIGATTFVVEDTDPLHNDGFVFHKLAHAL